MIQNKLEMSSKLAKYKKVLLLLLISLFVFQISVFAADISIDLSTDESGYLGGFDLLFLFAFLTLAPYLLMMMTSFTRIIIVFSFLRTAIGLQTTPPNQVVVGLSLFLTLFIMQPVLYEVNETAVEPYMAGTITQEEAFDNFSRPIKKFMLTQIREQELDMFLSLAGQKEAISDLNEESLLALGFEVIVPAFITRELKNAFTMGFLLFLPFLVIDLVVASTLMSMGMVMLPPTTIALPFKIMLFVVVDGWSLLIEMLVTSFMVN
ncbi:MAG: flagellar type III secretion system pore protein FliP [Clostridia bacterium]